MSVVEKLEEAIRELHLKTCPFAEDNSCTPEMCVIKQILVLFEAFKKANTIIPNTIIEEGKFVERAKILLSDYVFVPRKKLEKIDFETWFKENSTRILSYHNLHSHSGLTPSEVLEYFVQKELLGVEKQET